jgi:imidazolonepropionase-like amidohydrolase
MAKYKFGLLLICLVSCAKASFGQSDLPPALALINVIVIDVVAGAARPDMTVLILGNRISSVMPTGQTPKDQNLLVVDARDKFLIPGLWDMHVHALWDKKVAENFLPLFVANGVTGVRDMGGKMDLLRWFRKQYEAGSIVAPRVIAAGPILDGPLPVHPDVSVAVRNEEEARKAVQSLARNGVDFVKVYTMLPREAYLAIVDEAAKLGLPVAGHVPASVSAIEAASLGQRSMEHLRDEIEPFCTRRESAKCQDLLNTFRRQSSWQTPTLTLLRAKSIVDKPDLPADPRLAYVIKMVRDEWGNLRAKKLEQNGLSYFLEKQARLEDELWLVGEMQRADVPLLAGTDTGVLYSLPGFSLHDELELMVDVGLTPVEALRTATINAAEYLDATDDFGRIEQGKVADLVLLRENPLQHIGNTRSIEAVVCNGELLDRRALDRILAAAKALASPTPPGKVEGKAE